MNDNYNCDSLFENIIAGTKTGVNIGKYVTGIAGAVTGGLTGAIIGGLYWIILKPIRKVKPFVIDE